MTMAQPAKLLYLIILMLMLLSLSGCSVIAAVSYFNSEDDAEPAVLATPSEQPEAAAQTELDYTDGQSGGASQSAALEDEYQIGEMVIAVNAAIDAPDQSESMETIARYGTDSRYYVMIRGWLSQELNGVQSQLGAAPDHSNRAELQQKSDFLQASIRRIDLE